MEKYLRETRSWLGLGVKPEHNPLRLQFHCGYALREDSPPQGYTGERYAGYGGNGNGKKQYAGTDRWQRELRRELYPWD
ncbi:MAG: hypothetical protein ABSB22_18335 [Thermodesulfobacteriota bacterium]